ncbi:MAG TPA: sugar transporter [Bacteroidales bacterium]|nr:sugar transporter [Bacteroidales bacterium]
MLHIMSYLQSFIYKIFTILLFAVLLSGCSARKKLTYFRDLTAADADSINMAYHSNHESKIMPGDMLTIIVTGVDPEVVAPFNLPVVSYANPSTTQLATTLNMQAYLVDTQGEIIFPVIGKIKLGGLTKSEAIQKITDLLKPYLSDPIITINFLNYKISVMGEVARPGQYTINNERVTILDALALAGDMTPYGKRNTVLVARENNGKMEFQRINLNSSDVFTSPYYFLQQNDVVYVEPNNVRAVSSQNLSLYLSMVTTLASLATVIVSVVSLNKK